MYLRAKQTKPLRRARLGNLAPPNPSEGGGEIFANRADPFSAPFFNDMVGWAEASFPFSYDPSANNGNGQYTWKQSSFENQTMNNIDASQQFPSGGFLPGGGGSIVVAGGGSGGASTPVAPGTVAAPKTVPAWAWWMGGIAIAVFALTD